MRSARSDVRDPSPPSDVASPSMVGRRLMRWWVPVVLATAGFLLSWAGSWNVSLWADESATISAARRSLPDLWRLIHHIDAVHALYYAAMHGWISLFGFSEVSLRAPSAVAVAVTVVGVWVLASRLANRQVGFVAAIVCAVLPRTTWMGVEARPFAFSAAAAIWLSVVLWYLLDSGRDWLLATYAALAALAIAVNLYVGLLVIVHAIIVWTKPGLATRLRWRWSIAAAVGVVLASPVVLESAAQSAQLGQNSLTWPALLRNIVVNQWFLGATPTSTTGAHVAASSGLARFWMPAAIGLALLAAALTLILVAGVVHRGISKRDGSSEILLWCLSWLVLPTAFIGLYSMVRSPVYNPRYLSFATPAMAILCGAGICAISHRGIKSAVAILVVVLSLPIYLSQRQVHGKSGSDWSEVANYIAVSARPGQGVYFSPVQPPATETQGPTTRTIATAYPAAFANLQDLTLGSSAVATESLTASSLPLASVKDKLAAVGVVWMISRFDESADLRRSDLQILREVDLCAGRTWTGPLDQVTEFISC